MRDQQRVPNKDETTGPTTTTTRRHTDSTHPNPSWHQTPTIPQPAPPPSTALPQAILASYVPAGGAKITLFLPWPWAEPLLQPASSPATSS